MIKGETSKKDITAWNQKNPAKDQGKNQKYN